MAYSGVFEYPLTTDEVWLRLIGSNQAKKEWLRLKKRLEKLGDWHENIWFEENQDFIDVDPKSDQFLHAWRQLVDLDLLVAEQRLDKVYLTLNLPRLDTATIGSRIEQRSQRRQVSDKKRGELAGLIKLLKLFPGIAAAAVTGSLAVNNAAKDDDIDVWIITRPNRLWLVRFWLLLAVRMLSLYKKIAKSVAQRLNFLADDWSVDDWCFNLWMDRLDLKVPLKQQSIYTAYEICQADWLDFGLSLTVGQQVLETNDWIKGYLPQYYQQQLQALQAGRPTASVRDFNRNKLIKSVFTFLVSKCNQLFFVPQAKYIQKKQGIPRENLSLNQAFFHDNRSAQSWLTRWERRLALLISEISDRLNRT